MRERDALGSELRRLRLYEAEVLSGPEQNEREVEGEVRGPKLRVGTTWVNDYKTCTRQTQTNHCDDIAEGFGRAMKDSGHSWVFNLKNAQGTVSDWTDPAFGGADDAASRGADSVDFAFLATHGGIQTDEPDPYYVATFDHTACLWRSDKARLGNKQVKWVVLDTCQSLQNDARAKPWKTWAHAFDGLHTIFGFNHNTSDAWWSNDRGRVFGLAVGWDGEMGDAWIDAGYSWWLDDHPAAMAAGADPKDSHRRVETERLSSNFPGLSSSNVKNFSWIQRS